MDPTQEKKIKLQDDGKRGCQGETVFQMVKAGQKLHDEAIHRSMRYLNILR